MRFRLLTLAPALFFAICLDARAADAIISQQINFPGSNSLLSGTLTLPAGIAFQVPGVVLIQGSGPTDRDGNQPPVIRTDLLRQLADALARKGIASLRYDKRGMHANAMARPQAEADYASFFRWENFVADAAGAYRFLQRQGPVDPGKVAILGHSEGGLIALAAATSLQADGAAPPALILAATPGRRMDVILREQLERLLAEQHATPQQRRYFLAANTRITRAIRDTGTVPETVPPGLAGFYPSYIGQFWQSVLALDPAAMSRAYPGSVLILQGGTDTQISAERDALALDKALGERSRGDHALFIMPGTSHPLKPVDDDQAPGHEGDIDPGLLDRLTEWLLAKLAG